MGKNELWFRRKIYGWGWYPCSWEGWLVLLVWIIIFVTLVIRIDKTSNSANDIPYGFFILVVILVGILIGICYKKGEKPKWSWGR